MEVDGPGMLPEADMPIGEEAAYARSNDDFMEEDEELFVAEYHVPLVVADELTPMDTVNWCHDGERARSPVYSYTSMGSDSMYQSEKSEEDPNTRLQLERTDSFSSCYSFDSDDCEIRKPKVRSQDSAIVVQPPLRPELIRDPDEIRHPALTVGFVFKAISKTLGKLSEAALKYLKAALWRRYPETFTTAPQFMDIVDLVDRLLETYDLEVSLQITRALLKDMRRGELEAYLQELCIKNEVRYDIKITLKKRYAHIYEGMTTRGEQSERRDVGAVFSNVRVTSGSKSGTNVEHEVREIKKINDRWVADEKLRLEEIMGPAMIFDEFCGKLMTVGMAGMGKSMLVQKFIWDWAEGRCHQHIYFLLPLPFRELNQHRDAEMSFRELLHAFYPETERLRDFESDEGPFLFVCDGLDEYTGDLDFYGTMICADPEERAPLDRLMVNFLKGNLYYRSHVWLTSRPHRALRVPHEFVAKQTEALGFSDDEKEEYFRKTFEDPVQADRVIAHLNSCKTLHIMCHVPLFCWLVSKEFQRAFREQGAQAELPRSITLMYTKFLLTLLRTRGLRAPPRTPEEERAFLMTLGKLAYVMLDNGAQVQISKDHKKECGVDFEEAVVYSGLCTEFEIDLVLFTERTCCFTHSTVQEYLAALYVFLTFKNHGKNVLDQAPKGKFSRFSKDTNSLLDLCRSAVENSVHCEDGSLDVFLRFLLGMALEANHNLLKPFLTSSAKWSSVTTDIVAHLKKVIGEKRHPERNANLQRCLEELDEGTSGAASRR